MRRLLNSAVAIAALAVAAPAVAGPGEDLHALLDEHYAWALRSNPLTASYVGERRYDAELPDFTLKAADMRAKEEAAFLARARAIPADALSPADRTNKAILERLLSEDIEGNGFGQRTILFTSYSSPWQWLAGLGEDLSFTRKADYENYLTRLGKFPATNDTLLAITRDSLAPGYAQPCVTLGGVAGSISGVVKADVTQSRFYVPFAGKKPIDASEAEWSAMQQRAQTLIRDTLNPLYTSTAKYFTEQYLPKCAKNVGVSAQPNGAKYYAFRVRQETTTTLSPDRIHQIGLGEVARIRAEMEAVAKKAGFATREAFVQELRTNPKYYARTPEELMAAAARQAKIIDGKMPAYFGKLARLPYGVRAIPAETAEGTTTAYYSPGSIANGIAGFYYVNTSKLDQRPLWELPALTAHEAVPGHHQQIALQQELDIPEFRRHLTQATAFVEGWGLYSERIGIDMGLYDTPEKEMGRLSYEMWRACRLVVDTGIHSKGWSKEQAVKFMTDNTALSAANIDAEVNRYISWPGQALAYKLGELKIRELRAKAEKALGTSFDLKAFHNAVLGQGAVPLDVLEAQINAWINARIIT